MSVPIEPLNPDYDLDDDYYNYGWEDDDWEYDEELQELDEQDENEEDEEEEDDDRDVLVGLSSTTFTHMGKSASSEFFAAWLMGAIGATMWFGGKASLHAPYGERMATMIRTGRSRGPQMGTAFGLWSSIYEVSTDAAMMARNKRDGFNDIIGGFSSGFLISIRSGLRRALSSGAVGGVLLGLIECGGYVSYHLQQRTDLGFLLDTTRNMELRITNHVPDEEEEDGGAPQFTHWEHLINHFRGQQRDDRQPTGGPRMWRALIRWLSWVYSPEKNDIEHPSDPVPGRWPLSFAHIAKRLSMTEGNQTRRMPLPAAADKTKLMLVKLQEDLWDQQQKHKRERPRFAPQNGFTYTPNPWEAK